MVSQTPNSLILEEQTVFEEKPLRSRTWRAFWRHPLGLAGVIGLTSIVLFCFVGPLIYPASAYATHINALMSPPSAQFPLGTDDLGRNYLARLMLGGQVSLIVGFAAAIASMIIGVGYGLISGLAGGVVDAIMMRIIDVLLTIPTLFVLLFLDAVFQPNALLLTIILAITSWFGVTRIVRSEVLSLKQRDYVEASRAFGASNWHIMLHELLPNVMGTVMVATIFQIAGSIIAIATLSFLGLGLPAPAPNWGEMLSTSMNYMFQNAWWLIYPPGIALLWTLLSINFISEALQSALDTRL
ncbi:ABC transporter permease [Sulfobacillus thermosulfidooxidans]|uniref:ABC transporter permease n=1 Tax=Sulfobacillus thermosulfidooxidans TaxID=28034 RepID=UPI00096B6C03|nr:ABC transporter permease [Sulfobacillus thermosulfidooxidans]OLZ12222.1 peptide ABC transporter permease [Sulfobacillus thermosulfidooxidans]OLZ12997.1 peptide ABC transporter permease [Sulfobacillus thermosulfidooxidans]OLZ21798.1 peptide ABC transporter permease [Sulfobacillus thermosulfidooxidans]